MIAEVKNATFNQDIESGFRLPDDGIVTEVLDAYLQKIGMQPKWAKYFRKQFINDWNTCSLPIEKKIWAIEHGFKPSSILLYGLSDENYVQYLSDVDYMRLHPLNNHFAFWINDKITLKNIFAHRIESVTNSSISYNLMPDYYLYVENDGRFTYLMDSPKGLAHNEDYLLNLLKEKRILALKPSNGGGGYGFVKLEYIGNSLLWNGEVITETQLKEKQEKLNGYIVTEYLHQNKEFDSVCDRSTCTLRVIVVKNTDSKFSGGRFSIISSYARFGTNTSEGACNMHAGAVAIAYDSETGDYGDEYFRYRGFAEGGQTRFSEHPDSKIVLKGKKLPMYETVKDVVLTACSYLSSLDYFGVDVVVTNNEVKILEINSLPAISTPQVVTGPMLSIPASKTFFENKMAALNKIK